MVHFENYGTYPSPIEIGARDEHLSRDVRYSHLDVIQVAFVWGVFIFDERVRSRLNATVAIVLMVMGLWGMSYFSSPQRAQHVDVDVEDNLLAQSLLSGNNDDIESTAEDCDESAQNSVTESKWLDRLSKRQIGLLFATIDGVWGGSILVPMRFAK